MLNVTFFRAGRSDVERAMKIMGLKANSVCQILSGHISIGKAVV